VDEEGSIIVIYKKKQKEKKLQPTYEHMTKLMNKLDVVNKLVQIVTQREGN
jgi:hypothetical protein